MKRNPLIPFAIIAVIGILVMFLMSFKGLGDMEEIAAEKEAGEQQTEEPATASGAAELYTQRGCMGCHGGDYTGLVGPTLIGVGDKFSHEELIDILVNGVEGTTMPGGFPEENAAEMAEWLASLK